MRRTSGFCDFAARIPTTPYVRSRYPERSRTPAPAGCRCSDFFAETEGGGDPCAPDGPRPSCACLRGEARLVDGVTVVGECAFSDAEQPNRDVWQRAGDQPDQRGGRRGAYAVRPVACAPCEPRRCLSVHRATRTTGTPVTHRLQRYSRTGSCRENLEILFGVYGFGIYGFGIYEATNTAAESGESEDNTSSKASPIAQQAQALLRGTSTSESDADESERSPDVTETTQQNASQQSASQQPESPQRASRQEDPRPAETKESTDRIADAPETSDDTSDRSTTQSTSPSERLQKVVGQFADTEDDDSAAEIKASRRPDTTSYRPDTAIIDAAASLLNRGPTPAAQDASAAAGPDDNKSADAFIPDFAARSTSSTTDTGKTESKTSESAQTGSDQIEPARAKSGQDPSDADDPRTGRQIRSRRAKETEKTHPLSGRSRHRTTRTICPNRAFWTNLALLPTLARSGKRERKNKKTERNQRRRILRRTRSQPWMRHRLRAPLPRS